MSLIQLVLLGLAIIAMCSAHICDENGDFDAGTLAWVGGIVLIIAAAIWGGNTHAEGWFCSQCQEIAPTIVPPTTAPTLTPTATAIPTRTPTPRPTVTPTQAVSRIINFQEDTQVIFPSPFMGFETTQTQDSATSNPRRIPTTMMEFGQFIDEGYANIDAKLPQVAAAKQTMLLKIAMCDPDYGRYLQGQLPGFTFHVGNKPNQFCADLDNEQVLQRIEQAIAGYGARYNNDPRISHVDIRIVGLWGEWHYSATVPQVPMPSEASSIRIINAFKAAFPNKHLIAILDGKYARKHAAAVFSGLRMDCWGGLLNHEGPGKLYAQWYSDPDLTQVWQRQPVILEPCGPLTSENTTQRVDTAILRHATLINTKNLTDIPESQMAEWNRLLRRIGYRFVVRRAEIGAGTTFVMENVGIAPNYKAVVLRYGNEFLNIEKILPGQIVSRTFTATSGTLTLSMDGKQFRTANVEWNNGLLIQ